MDNEDKKIIRKNFELTQENHKMLKKMRRSLWIGNVTRILYWVIILGASVGTYYFLQPYIDSAKDAFGQIQSGVGVVSDGVTTTTQTTSKAVESILNFGKNIIGF